MIFGMISSNLDSVRICSTCCSIEYASKIFQQTPDPNVFFALKQRRTENEAKQVDPWKEWDLWLLKNVASYVTKKFSYFLCIQPIVFFQVFELMIYKIWGVTKNL